MKCFIGKEKKLEDNTMFYREPVQIDKDWSGHLLVGWVPEIPSLFIFHTINVNKKTETPFFPIARSPIVYQNPDYYTHSRLLERLTFDSGAYLSPFMSINKSGFESRSGLNVFFSGFNFTTA